MNIEALKQNQEFIQKLSKAADAKEITALFAAQGITVREEDKEFIARVYSYIFIGIMLDWIKDDMKADPKLIVDRLAILIKDSLAGALERFKI